MALLDPLHPRFVHFPVALLATGSIVALVYLLGWRRSALPGLAWATILLGWLSIFPAMLSGLVDRNRAPTDAAILSVMNPHIAASFGLLIIYGLLLYERLRSPDALDQPRRRWLLIGLLALGLALLTVVGWLGGKLVYDLGVGVQQ
jgi:uncharacterized membrane protein